LGPAPSSPKQPTNSAKEQIRTGLHDADLRRPRTVRFDGSNPKHPALPKSSAGTRSGPQLGRAIRPRATLSV